MATLDELSAQERAEINDTTRRLGTQRTHQSSGSPLDPDEAEIRQRTLDPNAYNPRDNKYSRHRYISNSHKVSSMSGSALSNFFFWPFKLLRAMPPWAWLVGTIWSLMVGFGLFWTVITYFHGQQIHDQQSALIMTGAMVIASFAFPTIIMGVITAFGLTVRTILNMFTNS